MNKLTEMIDFKAAVLKTVLLTILFGFFPKLAKAAILIPGINYSAHHTHQNSNQGATAVDPSAGVVFDGRITVRFDRNKVFPISEFGWFGAFSNQPDNSFLDTGDGIFADADIPANLLPPSENLNVSVCNVRFGDPIGCDFDPFVSLRIPGEEFSTIYFSPQDFLDDDFFAVNFDFGNEGLIINTDGSFNFFGFSYQFNQQAFDDRVVGISLVDSGTGDIGLVPIEGFNIINCIPQGSPDSNFATDRCGEPSTPLDVQYVTRSQILAASQVPGFSFNPGTNEGFLATGEPFQLFQNPLTKVDEPHNNLALLALGAFGVNLILKGRRKHQKSS